MDVETQAHSIFPSGKEHNVDKNQISSRRAKESSAEPSKKSGYRKSTATNYTKGVFGFWT